jgi:hypothetical protein
MLPPLMGIYEKKNGKLNDAKLKELSSSHTQSTSITESLDSRKETRHTLWDLIDLAAILPPMYANKLARNPANDQWIPNSKDTLLLLPQNADPRGKTETGKKMRSSSIHLLQQALLQSQDTAVQGIFRSANGQWIPVFAYSCQSLLLCCTAALSPSSGSTSFTIAPTEAALIQWGQRHIQSTPHIGQ